MNRKRKEVDRTMQSGETCSEQGGFRGRAPVGIREDASKGLSLGKVLKKK